MEDKITAFMTAWIAGELKREVGPDARLAALGLDSIDFVRLADALADHLAVVELPVGLIMEQPTVVMAARAVAALVPIKG
jgi:acyl carrier protein